MLVNVIFNSLNIEIDTQKDLLHLFKYIDKLSNKVILAINTYTMYLLMKRGVVE